MPASRLPHHRRSLLGKLIAPVPQRAGGAGQGRAYRGVLVETGVSPAGECIPHRTGAMRTSEDLHSRTLANKDRSPDIGPRPAWVTIVSGELVFGHQ
jgi:hypothetical protein